MRGVPEVFLDFSGGVNLDAAPYLLQPNQAQDALNVQTNAAGQLRKRNGFTTHADLSASPASFTGPAHSLFAANPSTKQLVAVGPISGGDRPVSITVGGTVVDLTRSSGGAYTANTPWYIVQAEATSDSKGPFFAMNGVDTPQEWDGTTSDNFTNWTAASGTLPTTGKFLVYHGSRLWCTNAASSSRLRFSGITGTSSDTGNWDTSNYVDLEPGDGQEITAIAPFGAYLLVFKPRKTYVITDLVSGANRQISDTIGCISHRSCVDTEIGLIFLDEEQGVCVTDGNSIRQISGPVETLLAQARSFPATMAEATGVYHDNRYFLSFSTNGDANNRTIEYDISTDSWWIHDCASNQFALIDPVGTPQLYSVDPAATRTQQAFVEGEFQDSGSNYAGGAFWAGAEHVFGYPHLRKRVREVRVDGAGEWTLGYAVDHFDDYTDDSGETWISTVEEGTYAPTASLGELYAPSVSTGDTYAPLSSAVTERHYYTLGVHRSWAFKFTNDDSGDFRIYSYSVAIDRRRD